MTGKAADRVLEQLQTLWDIKKRKNRIRIKTPAVSDEQDLGEQSPNRRVDPTSDKSSHHSPRMNGRSSVPRGRLVGTAVGVDSDGDVESSKDESNVGADIVIYRSPTGLVITSEDTKRSPKFEHLCSISPEQIAEYQRRTNRFYLSTSRRNRPMNWFAIFWPVVLRAAVRAAAVDCLAVC